MGIREKMMDMMMGNMTFEEKEHMMSEMMNSFFEDMTPEEKSRLMEKIMPKMMEQMMGGGGMMGMMRMMMGGGGKKEGSSSDSGKDSASGGTGCKMGDMMSKMMGPDSPMMQMCKMMRGNANNDDVIKVTPEIKNLFKEWSRQIEEEIKNIIKDNKDITPQEIAAKLKLSEESIKYFLDKMNKDTQSNAS